MPAAPGCAQSLPVPASTGTTAAASGINCFCNTAVATAFQIQTSGSERTAGVWMSVQLNSRIPQAWDSSLRALPLPPLPPLARCLCLGVSRRLPARGGAQDGHAAGNLDLGTSRGCKAGARAVGRAAACARAGMGPMEAWLWRCTLAAVRAATGHGSVAGPRGQPSRGAPGGPGGGAAWRAGACACAAGACPPLQGGAAARMRGLCGRRQAAHAGAGHIEAWGSSWSIPATQAGAQPRVFLLWLCTCSMRVAAQACAHTHAAGTQQEQEHPRPKQQQRAGGGLAAVRGRRAAGGQPAGQWGAPDRKVDSMGAFL